MEPGPFREAGSGDLGCLGYYSYRIYENPLSQNRQEWQHQQPSSTSERVRYLDPRPLMQR